MNIITKDETSEGNSFHEGIMYIDTVSKEIVLCIESSHEKNTAFNGIKLGHEFQWSSIWTKSCFVKFRGIITLENE